MNGSIPACFLALALGLVGSAAQDGTLVYGGGLIPRGLNPNLAKNDWNEASNVLLNRLFQIDDRGEIEPDLVKSYRASGDGRLYSFTLREDVAWHDGTPFTAADVDFTFRTLFDPKVLGDLDLNMDMVESFTADGPHTFSVKLKVSSPSFLSTLSDPGILPRHLLEGKDLNSDAYDRTPIGTGPYRLVEKVSPTEWRFQANPRFHRGKPAIARLTLKIYADDDERARSLAAGEIHLGQVKPQHIEMLQKAGLRVYRMPSGAWRGMPQNTRRTFLRDPRVRRAISMALDREAIVARALLGAGKSAYLPVPPGSWAHFSDLYRSGRDLEGARKLLAEAGWTPGAGGTLEKDGVKAEYVIGVWKDEIFRRTTAELVRDQLGELGIPVRVDLLDNAGYLRVGNDMGTTHDTIVGGWSGLLDPDMNLYKKFHTGGSQNTMAYSNQEVDRLLQEGRSTLDREKRKEIYRKLLAILLEEQPFIPLAYPDYVFAARKDLRGIQDGMLVDSWYYFTRQAYRWRLGP